MTRVIEHQPGALSWVDLSTTDQAAAKDFYHHLFGWEYNDVPAGPGAVYSMARLGDLDVAAIGPQPPGHDEAGVPSMWQVYVATDDVDATADLVRQAGGEVLAEPFDVVTAGRMAVVRDPTGAAFCLWQAKEHPGVGLLGETGALTWAEVNTRDRMAATTFYSEVFAWGASDFGGTPAGYTMFTHGGRPLAGALQMDEHWEGIPPHWMVYFQVDDADAAAAAASERGGAVRVPPFDTPPGRIAVIGDPQGATFSVIKPNPDFNV